MNKYLLIAASTFLIILSTTNCFSQDSQDEESQLILLRAENFLQVIRDENWYLLYDYTVIATGKKDSETKRRLNISDDDSVYQRRKKVGEFFKSVYGKLKPGKIVRPVNYINEDKTLVGIGYKHGDLDGFRMQKIDGKWYHTLE